MSRTRIRTLAVATAATLFAVAAATSYRSVAEDKPARPPVVKKDAPRQKALSKFMREKLDASSQVLEGLAVEDFDLIEKGAARMHKLGAAEEWQITNDPLYRQHSAQFQRVMEKLQKNAKDKELEGAALTWIEGTMSCIECHKWVRNQLVAAP